MRTISFCGDSWCAGLKTNSWCNLLADRLNSRIKVRGKPGTAYEYAIKSFDPTSDVTVFLWTEASRLYHKDFKCTYNNKIRRFDNMKTVELLSASAEIFYRTFYTKDFFEELQMRSLYWFDNEVLSKYKGLAIHIFCFEKTYHFSNGINVDHIMHTQNAKEAAYDNHLSLVDNKLFSDKLFTIISQHESKV